MLTGPRYAKLARWGYTLLTMWLRFAYHVAMPCLLCGANFILTAFQGEAGCAKDYNKMSLLLQVTSDCDFSNVIAGIVFYIPVNHINY
jgi:hypothetical protein